MLEALVESAFEYTYPLFAVAQTRYRAVQDPGNPNRHAPNTVKHERQLSDHTSRWITAPNNDTLYSNAWLDLSCGPVGIRVSTQPSGRYWSLAFMDAFTNHFAMIGQRRDGSVPVDVTLVGPGQQDTELPGRIVRAPGNDVWLISRWLVDGTDDLSNSHAMQNGLEVLPPSGASYCARVATDQSTDPRNFLAVVNESLARNRPPASEASLVEGWAAVGLCPGAVDAWQGISEDAQQVWTAQMGALHDNCDGLGPVGGGKFRAGWPLQQT